MILEDIKKLERKIRDLQAKIDSFSGISAIQYDKDKIQSSGGGRMVENMALNLIEQQREVERLKALKDKLVSSVPMDKFTKKQQRFISLYFFQDFGMEECSSRMRVKIRALYKIKDRIFLKTLEMYNENVV